MDILIHTSCGLLLIKYIFIHAAAIQFIYLYSTVIILLSQGPGGEEWVGKKCENKRQVPSVVVFVLGK